MKRVNAGRLAVAMACGFVWAGPMVVGQAAMTTDYFRATATLSVGTATNTGSMSTALGDGTVSSASASYSEGYRTRATGDASHAEGAYTEANAAYSHAGGQYSRVAADKSRALIHATGASNSYKEAQYADTAHFDRLHLFEPANDHSNSVLARWQSDARFVNVTGDYVANYLFVGDGLFNGGSLLTYYDTFGVNAYNYTPVLVARQDSSSNLLTETRAGLVIYNDAGTTNSWAKMAFAGREAAGAGNAVTLAGIAAQRMTAQVGGWAVGDLVLWTKYFGDENEQVRVKGNSGYVGIGTANPTVRLQVAGTARADVLQLGTANSSVKLNLGTDLANTKLALYDDPGDLYGLGVQAYQLRFHLGSSVSRFSFLSSPAGTEVFTIKGTGNVGVGTNTPSAKLDVSGDGRFASGVRFPAQGDISMGSYTNGTL